MFVTDFNFHFPIGKLKEELGAYRARMDNDNQKKYDDLLKEHTNAKGGVNDKFVKDFAVKQLREMYKTMIFKPK